MVGRERPYLEDDRGQTLQDYVVGISVFVVVVFLALAFFPQLLAGFQTTDVADDEARADRIARQIVTDNGTANTANQLDATAMETLVTLSEDDLRDRFRLNATANLNITVETLDGEDYVESGDPLRSVPNNFGSAAGTTTRIVTLSNESARGCAPACRLVVRVW